MCNLNKSKGLNIIYIKLCYSRGSLLTSGLDLLCTNSVTVSRKHSFINHDFQSVNLILDFFAPKNGNKGLIPENYCSIE